MQMNVFQCELFLLPRLPGLEDYFRMARHPTTIADFGESDLQGVRSPRVWRLLGTPKVDAQSLTASTDPVPQV
jgi:hypothetical protein